MLTALVISNGIGAADAYQSNTDIRYDVAEVGPGFRLDLDGYDILLVPNGADHVAMLSVRDDVRAFLERGGALFCFCGWFTNWIPGNRWIHDNRHPTREVRHHLGTDRHGLFAGVDLAKFDHNRHGISGWWACGYIEPAAGADAVLLDTWDRALVVLDETTTPGLILATASGPLGDFGSYGGGALAAVYDNLLRHVASRRSPLPSASV